MQVGIIIPTRNRARSLDRLLRSLDAVHYPQDAAVRVVVIDNASTDGTAETLRRHSTRPRSYPLVILEQPIPGKANAVNRGLAASRSDLTIVLDDDVTADKLFLQKHLEAYRDTAFAALQGRIIPGKDAEGRSADPKRLREYNIPTVDYGEGICEIRGLTGTNMSFKREVFEQVGFFDPRLGPGAAGFSEDTEFSIRIRKAGFKIGYTPHAIVYHELDPSRYGREYNRRIEFRKGLSRSIYRNDSLAFRVIPNLVANCMRYGIYRLLRNQRKAYTAEGRVMKCCGYLIGKLPQRSKPRRPSDSGS
jgi:GT2 family glycosyltransferase